MTNPQHPDLHHTPYYITTPIYYVNDRPHIGHCYTTVVADALARFMRMAGRDVLFLTGTDEHAEKVVEAAAQNGMSPQQWADRNAAEFERAFAFMQSSHDDFIRTTERRHTAFVERAIGQLREQGDVYLGDYEGWYDPSQEEYVTETTAKEHEYKSPVTGRDLVRRTEQNYFFRLSAYADRLGAHIREHEHFILPEARRNEVLGRIRGGLQDVPISRAVQEGQPAWGIAMPGDEKHRVYVWIDALCNYLSALFGAASGPEESDSAGGGEGGSDGRDSAGGGVGGVDVARFWPADVHLIAKDILWFHAVIWPCMLMALGRELPRTVYAHSYWIREGRKMSKSLGNFLDLPTIEAYAERYSVDALRYYLLTHGPLGVTDADFAHAHFVEVYNADLANGFGNAHSRVTNMIAKYFGGNVPEPGPEAAGEGVDWAHEVRDRAADAVRAANRSDTDAMLRAGLELSNRVDRFIGDTRPFTLAKDEANLPRVGTILYQCAEALRVAAYLLSPAMPAKMCDAIGRLGYAPREGVGFEELITWGQLAPGSTVTKGEPLFPRADAEEGAPG